MPLTVIPYQVKRKHHARRGLAAIEPGTTVYLITTARRDLYYHFSYLSRETAEKVAKRLEADLSDVIIQFNFKADPEASLHSDPKL
jgi:hypothetical protein